MSIDVGITLAAIELRRTIEEEIGTEARCKVAFNTHGTGMPPRPPYTGIPGWMDDPAGQYIDPWSMTCLGDQYTKAWWQYKTSFLTQTPGRLGPHME